MELGFVSGSSTQESCNDRELYELVETVIVDLPRR